MVLVDPPGSALYHRTAARPQSARLVVPQLPASSGEHSRRQAAVLSGRAARRPHGAHEVRLIPPPFGPGKEDGCVLSTAY